MSAYYVQNPVSAASPTARIRQEGFQIPASSPSLNAPPSPTTPFGDSQNSTFFAGSHNVFPNAFKKFNDRNAIDFSDTLASMMSDAPQPDHSDLHRGPSTFRTPLEYPHASSSQPQQQQTFFDISSFPSHLNNFRGSAADPAAAAADVPLPQSAQSQSLGHNFLGDPPLTFHQPQQHRPHRSSFSAVGGGPPPVLPRLNTMRTSSPAGSHHVGSPSDMNVVVPSSPFSPSLGGGGSAASAGGAPGVQPSSGAVRSTSRSRSRTRTATGAVAERNASVGARSSRVTKKRTQSISSPSPPANIVAQSSSNNNNGGAQPLAMSIIIPDPRSAPSHHAAASPATTVASWGVFSPSSAHTAFSLPNGGDAISTAATSFNNTFAPQGSNGQSLPLGGIVMDDDKTPPNTVNAKEDPSSKQAALLNEKRRRRRESHNAVERRRRDNINEKINELATLIPECLLIEGGGSSPNANGDGPDKVLGTDPELALLPSAAQGAPTAAAGSGDDDINNAANAAAMKANKGVIVRKSVDYIRYLQQLVHHQSEKNRDLEMQLAAFRGGDGSQQHFPPNGPPGNGGDFSSSSSSSDPSMQNGGLMYAHDGVHGPPEPFAVGSEFPNFDFGRFGGAGPAGGSNDPHHQQHPVGLVSVKEEDPSGMMDLHVLPDDSHHGLSHHPHHHPYMQNGGFDHPQQQQQNQGHAFDLAGYHGQGQQNFQQFQQQQFHPLPHQQVLQQQQQMRDGSSPSGANGSGGSNISDLEDVEEEDETNADVVGPDTRGRKDVRDAQPGRFANSHSAARHGSHSQSQSRSLQRPNSVSRRGSGNAVKQQTGEGGGTPEGADAMHVDERS